MFSVSKQKDL
uniref:Uncharacterized protein n=1 Tax=Lepeophtheirus salmonis TaxID=72036 RepID=A0A0K2TII3_LEPSM